MTDQEAGTAERGQSPPPAQNAPPPTKTEQLAFVNTLLFETPGGLRFTQDSPVLPNVWFAFALEPRSQQELILTANHHSGTGQAALELRRMLKALREARPMVGESSPIPRQRARVSYIPGQLAVKLYFDEMMRVVLPLTPWWHETYNELRALERMGTDLTAEWRPFPQPDSSERREEDLLDALMLMRRDIDASSDLRHPDADALEGDAARQRYIQQIPPSLSWFVRIAGVIADCFANGTELLHGNDSISHLLRIDFTARPGYRIEDQRARDERQKKLRLSPDTAKGVRRSLVRAFTGLYTEWVTNEEYPTQGHIWRVTKNRRVHLAVAKSALTVKADAARSLFDISCRDITWAVLDSGIDAKHPAFRLTSSEHEQELRRKPEYENELPVEALDSRVVMTLDFTYLRELLDYEFEGDSGDKEAQERRTRLLDKIVSRMTPSPFEEASENPSRQELESQAIQLLDGLRRRIADGKDISWQDLEGAIVSKNPPTPTNDHGTHVAGILGADWIEDWEQEQQLPLALRSRRMTGICPDINLIDVRVFREDGLTDEFELLAAVQYLRWMNSRAGTMQVHGANLSLSLVHEVRRFACGRTPICDECNEAAALGMVMVAAAGNRGFEMTEPDEVRASDNYKSVSITDPGNAADVITVGATHRKRPHEYGVSYFSSRGPTGDGRLKPDLVAPGEKIKGPTPYGRAEFKDGTSMAAPHVSGVAALLMARHSELIGQPVRIKKILCETATDLERERYFQGHGLVDALRALQSV